MGAFTGPQHKGARAVHLKQKREDADKRSVATRWDRRADHRPHVYPASVPQIGWPAAGQL